jgi:hypothetical protein
MAVVDIPVNNGFSNASDESLEQPGSLSRADDSEYRPNDPGLWKMKGRTAFNSTAESGDIKGAAYLEFDSVDDMLVTHVGTTYRKATVAKTGTFGDLKTGLTGGSKMVAVHYNDRYYLMNGVDPNRYVQPDGTTMRQSLLAAGTPTTVTTEGGDNITLTSDESFDIWVTEQTNSNAGASGVDSGIEGPASTRVTISGPITDAKVTITLAAPVNTELSPGQGITYTVYISAAYSGTSTGFPVGGSVGQGFSDTAGTSWSVASFDITSLATGATFDAYSVSIAGITQIVERNGAVPVSSTGDVFEDSVVVNDVDNPALIMYSYPDQPWTYPSVNFVRFETNKQDSVTNIKRLGNGLVVCLTNSMWRLAYLPRPQDAEFDRGRVKTRISNSLGCVGPYAADTFNFGQGERLAVVSRNGILVTDGQSWDVVTDDLAWEDTVNVSQLSNAILVDNPQMYRLEFYYTPLGGSANTKVLYLHYHPSHAKASEGGNFRAKLTGPNNALASSATYANVSSEDRVFTGNPDGVVYLEREGDSDASTSGGINFVLRTDDIYGAGRGNQANIEKLWVHHNSAPTQTATVRILSTNSMYAQTEQTGTIALDRRELTAVGKRTQADVHQLGVENSDSSGAFRVDYFTVQGKGYGESREP